MLDLLLLQLGVGSSSSSSCALFLQFSLPLSPLLRCQQAAARCII
jgi:hypothetical protein